MTIQEIKNRFGIIGTSPLLDRAIDIARQVAGTNLTVLITGESGVGKEIFSKIIHQLSSRKHGSFIAVNCGAIPEGTIDSELFGHEKGAFTGAHDARKGYFEVVNGGTIFLDEVADLPLQTQVRLLRVLETGEFMRVGSSKVQKTDVRVVAATNLNMLDLISRGKFREDLYYRLNTVPIHIPSLRDRKDDVEKIFRKFAQDFAEKYRIPPIRLTESARELLQNYRWPGNIRQLKNITEQISILEKDRDISAEILVTYLPAELEGTQVPALLGATASSDSISDRELIYKFLYDMKRDMVDLKKLVMAIMQSGDTLHVNEQNAPLIQRLYEDYSPPSQPSHSLSDNLILHATSGHDQPVSHAEIEESLSLEDREKELIEKALAKHRGKRKSAAGELGISERTLYRKIKEYNIKN
ncbi:MAG: sigma-54-dependent Fis family transcriptional regulator [Candidatus Competibacteraceae bacterium]|nr:sigma-54-dependent Fis family transcriptional regulator [Candidatus Competibacteraceae bacterium]